MKPERPVPSHPLAGWAFVLLGGVGLLASLGAYLTRCATSGVAAWPLSGPGLDVLAGVVRAAFPAAILLVLGVLLPLQHLGRRVERHPLLARLVTTVILAVLGGGWLLRLNLAGFGSLWARREPLGELLLPAALLENRVWSANIMVVFVVALASLPLNTLVRRLLAQPALRRPPWPLWLLAAMWWVGLVAVLLVAGRR